MQEGGGETDPVIADRPQPARRPATSQLRAELRQPLDVCSSPEPTCLLRGNEMTRMGWTGRAPAPNGSQSAWGACQKQEHRHASQVHGSRSHHHRN